MKRALGVLQRAMPEEYAKVCTHVAAINPNPVCGSLGYGCFQASPANRGRATIDIGTETGSLIMTAAVIVHETCHAIQFHEHRDLIEEECQAADERVVVPLAPGCYVRGTRSMYLKPDDGMTNPDTLAHVRAAALTKYATFSRDFWATRR
jgi:hypothetical protein